MRGTSACYFRSLNRHFNVFGVDRQLFFLFLAMCMPIVISARFVPLMDGVAVVVFLALYTIGVLITRADNQMLAFFSRHIKYKNYYAATPGIHAPIRIVKPSVPFYQGKRGLV